MKIYVITSLTFEIRISQNKFILNPIFPVYALIKQICKCKSFVLYTSIMCVYIQRETK